MVALAGAVALALLPGASVAGVTGKLSGRVLEVGAGNGVNFGHYPPTVEEVVALEPEPFMRGKAQHAAAKARVEVRVVDGVSSRLPFESSTFDAVVASLVLCSVPELDAALSELRRVIKDGGELRFLEHVDAMLATMRSQQGKD